ncbi:oxygenase MpaB family protein [Arthrobacter sp. 35W]|uniref:oxygenase MpaB family protein n=1 Tax=Arthrobacter sp. 35W TaxID=1132441 RepID=UPI0003FCEEFB|nr:oxygenase MpaB family protein [Arthrobacter sp. 35W]
MTREVQDIGAEGILLAGGARAILLQLAHPAVGRGVAEHSTFAADPIARLQATMTYVYGAVYGTEEQVAEVRRRVNRAHAKVRSAEGAEGAGPAYNAYDPHLQLWVAATLYQTAATLHTEVFGAPSDDVAERLYAHYAILGTVLQMPPGLWPADRAAFARYWDAQLAQLQVTDAARAVARDLLYPAKAPLWLRSLMPTARLVTAGLLPPQLRGEFGLQYSAAQQRRYARLLGTTAVVYPKVPRRLRHALRDHYLKRLRPTPGPAA